jgi:hypothetical protein
MYDAEFREIQQELKKLFDRTSKLARDPVYFEGLQVQAARSSADIAQAIVEIEKLIRSST